MQRAIERLITDNIEDQLALERRAAANRPIVAPQKQGIMFTFQGILMVAFAVVALAGIVQAQRYFLSADYGRPAAPASHAVSRL